MITKLSLIISILMMGLGATRGEVSSILIKSINICLECIGVG
ncbi:CD1871A family CXXC motif-containing protein [Anaeromicrobium sediminis]|nr:CD1871A family CXXC motif-containing protein [Anaeromicrobium sediminis]